MSQKIKDIVLQIFPFATLILVAVAYGFGLQHNPIKTVTVHDVQTKEDTSAREQVRKLTAELERVKRDTHRVIVVVKKPDGTTTKTTTEDTHTDRTTETKTDTKTDSQTHTETKTDTHDRKTVENDRPAWRVHALVGLQTDTSAFVPVPVYGAQVEHRFVGPISAGVWVLVRPNPTLGVTAGLSLSLEF